MIFRNPNNDLKETDNKFLKSQKDIFENNSYTNLFKKIIIDKGLMGYFENILPELTNYLYKRMIRDCIHYECKQDIQYLYVDYIAPISPDDVEFEEWKDLRKELLLKWAHYHSLNKIYFDFNGNKVLYINTLPVVKREYDLESEHNKLLLVMEITDLDSRKGIIYLL